MEFTCRVSYKDFGDALRLKRKNLGRAIYALLIVDIFLWIYWMVLAGQGRITESSRIFLPALELFVWPVFFIVLSRTLGYFNYKRNRNIQSEFVFRLTEAELSYQSSSGGAGKSPWTSMSYWRESRRVFILVFPSGVFLICPKSFMGGEQQEEFKRIAGAALPKK